MGADAAPKPAPRAGTLEKPAAAPDTGKPEGMDPAYIGETLLVLAFLGVAISMLAIPFAVYATYSGSLRWIITLALVTIAALAGLRALYPLGAKGDSPAAEERFARDDGGRYGPLKEMSDRARQGYAYSQKALSERMADAFLEKMRIRKGLDPGTVYMLSGNEAALGAACGDAELARFVVESKAAMSEDPERRKRFTSRKEMLERGSAYVSRTEAIIGKIEAWEG
jgi:hypothetical protein